jgi:hypothetical protein
MRWSSVLTLVSRQRGLWPPSEITAFVGEWRIVQVPWGERNAATECNGIPAWTRTAHQTCEHIWREVRVLDEPQDDSTYFLRLD